MNPQTPGVPAIPGDPEQVRRLSALFATVETRAQEIQSRLRAIETGIGPQVWRGQAADGFTALLAETGPDLTTLAASYGMASQALATYATELAAAQDAVRAAQAEASTASADRDRASVDRDTAGSDADRHAAAATEAQLRLDPVGAQDAEQRRADALQRANAAEAAADQAQQAFQAAQRKAEEAAARRDAAAARCVRELDEASSAGIDTRNLAQSPTAGSAPQAATSAAETVGLRNLGSGAVEQAAVDGTEDGTGAVLAGVTLAGAGHRVVGPAAASIVRSFAGAPGPVPPPPIDTDAAGNAAWWRGLNPAQKEQVLRLHPEWVGNRDGIPAADRDKANRALLDRETARVDRELAAAAARLDAALGVTLPPGMEGQGETRDQIRFRLEVERLTELRNALAAVANAINAPGRQLLVLDVSGHEQPRAAVAVGSIDADGNTVGVDTADHVAVFTPGLETTVAGSLGHYVNDMAELQTTARRQLADAGRDDSVALVAWLGYDAPQLENTVNPDQSVAAAAPAQRGGTALAGFLDGVLASRPEDPHLTALGHSYGSTTTGYALQQVDGVDDAVLFGSPGAATDDIADLRVPPGNIAVLEARGDAVADLGRFGTDTNQLDGVTNLSAREETAPDGTLLRESQDHSEYLVPGTTSQHNIAATVAGLPELRITGPNAGVGDVLREAWDAF